MNNQLFETKNQDLNDDICILKTRLNQEIDAVKKLTEERDSLKTALKIVTRLNEFVRR